MSKHNNFEKGKREGDRDRKFRESGPAGKRAFSSEKPGSDRFGGEKPRFGQNKNFDRPARRRFEDKDAEPNFGTDRDFKPRREFSSRTDRDFKPKRDFGSRTEKDFGSKVKRDYGSQPDRDFHSRPKREFGPKTDRDFPARRDFGSKSERDFDSRKDASDERRPFDRRDRRSKSGYGSISSPRTESPRFKSDSKSGFQSKPAANFARTDSQASGLIRLNRFIANAGVCSRREADDLIESGQISVNGKVITEMGFKVKKSDVVRYGKRVLSAEKPVYILLNKPKGFITTTEDPEDRKTVLDLIQGACEERVYPVGRLDRNTTGLLLITNDGELADKLTHPSNSIRKIYQAELDRPITLEDFEAIRNGIELEDGFIKPDDVGIVTPDAYVVGIEIHSGRNRIVRRIFEHFNYEVKKLDRTVFAGLTKKDLPRGKWRLLTEKEVLALKQQK